MGSISEEEEILEAAVTGIPRVAEVVASIPEKARAKALAAVESTYRQTMLERKGLLRVGLSDDASIASESLGTRGSKKTGTDRSGPCSSRVRSGQQCR